MISIQEGWFDQRLSDGGPLYMETHQGQFIVEPWNAVSSLFMLIPAIYWIWKFRRSEGKNTMLWIVTALIITGGLGSALFHGFRASVFFLVMDVLPSAILTLTLSIYFWIRILKKWWYVFFIMLPLFGSRFIFWGKLPEHASINLGYFLTGVSISLPLIILLFKSHFSHWTSIVLAILSFGAALAFRQIDQVPISFLPMGTHFLWHSFSAVGAWFILDYLYKTTRTPINEEPDGQIPV